MKQCAGHEVRGVEVSRVGAAAARALGGVRGGRPRRGRREAQPHAAPRVLHLLRAAASHTPALVATDRRPAPLYSGLFPGCLQYITYSQSLADYCIIYLLTYLVYVVNYTLLLSNSLGNEIDWRSTY